MTQTHFTEISCLSKTDEHHFNVCQLLNGPLKSHYSTTYSINRSSILNDIPGFSVINGVHHDITHDVFEGVAQYEIKLLLQHYISLNYFSLQVFNSRVEKYNFPGDTPSNIDERVLHSNDRKLRQSASQMMSITSELPFLIGDKITIGDPHWEAFLALLRI